MHVTEPRATATSRMIAELPTCSFAIDAGTSVEEVKRIFDAQPELAGAIIIDGNQLFKVLSRDCLFRHLSRPFFRELFCRRPIREFARDWCPSVLRLEAACTINIAAERALARPHEQAFDPILVDYGKRFGLLDTQVLLVAQAQLLSLSRDVERQRDAAEAANRSKSEFLANISHELRTPLHGILSYTRFGLEETESAEQCEVHEFFENVHNSAETLLHLVNELLDLSKLEAGRMTYEFRLTDLNELAQLVIDEFRSQTASRKLTIELSRPEEAISSMVDPGRMQQVLRNLLSNAVKFAPNASAIHVRVRRISDLILLSVRDEGPGIPPDEMEAVFDKFVQSSKTKTNSGGTGLGLAISREIVAAHKGRIWVENNDGAGCVFYVELPLVADDSLDDDCETGQLCAAEA